MSTKLDLLYGSLIRALEGERAKIDEQLNTIRGLMTRRPILEAAKIPSAAMSDKRRAKLSAAMKASWVKRKDAGVKAKAAAGK